MSKLQHGKRLRQMKRLRRIMPFETWMDMISSSMQKAIVRAFSILASELYKIIQMDGDGDA